MSIREMLSKGEFTVQQKIGSIANAPSIKELVDEYWDEQYTDDHDNFLFKDSKKASRLQKSSKARAHRKSVKQLKHKAKQENTNSQWDKKRIH